MAFVARLAIPVQRRGAEFRNKAGHGVFRLGKLAASVGQGQWMAAQQVYDLRQLRVRAALRREFAEQRAGVVRLQFTVQLEAPAGEVLAGIARKHQPAHLRAQHGEQLLQGRAVAGFLGAFHHHQGAAFGAGARGPFARGERRVVAGGKAVRQRGPDPVRVGLEPVEVEEHQAVGERAAGQVPGLVADGHADGLGGEGGLAEASRAEDAGVLAPAEAVGERVALRVAADQHPGADRGQAVKGRVVDARAGWRNGLDFDNHRRRLERRGWWRRWRGWRSRARREDAVFEQVARGAANLGVRLARLGDGEMILIEPHRIGAHAGMGGGGVDDGHAFHGAQFVVRHGANARLVRPPAIPVEEIPQMRVVGAQVFDADRGAEHRVEGIGQGRQRRAGMGRGQEQDRARVREHSLPPRLGGIGRLAENLLGEQAAQTVADEEKRAFAQAALDHEVEHLKGAVGQRHAVAGVAPAAAEQTQEPRPLRRAGRITERPDPDIRELLAEPVRPRRGSVLAVTPGLQGIAAQAVDEDDIGLARGVRGTGDLVQSAHACRLPVRGCRGDTARKAGVQQASSQLEACRPTAAGDEPTPQRGAGYLR